MAEFGPKRWRDAADAVAAATEAIEKAMLALAEMERTAATASDPAAAALLRGFKACADAREAMPAAYLFRPQSEWTGGPSDDPSNHRLREPHACPPPRRYFTEEELERDGLRCVGPCQWTETKPEEP